MAAEYKKEKRKQKHFFPHSEKGNKKEKRKHKHFFPHFGKKQKYFLPNSDSNQLIKLIKDTNNQ